MGKSKILGSFPPAGKPKTLDLERLVCDFLSFVPDEETKRKYMELGRRNQKQNIAINYNRDALKHAIRQQGREYKNGRLVPIGHERFNIKAGTWYVCVKDGIFGGYPDGDTHFHKGEVYFCDEKGIIDHNSNNFHEDFKHPRLKVWDYFRPWDIYDARPGDVLCDMAGNVGIFEKVFGHDWHSAAYLGCNGMLMTGLGGSHCIEGSTPATREQRDLLLKKMQESGYRWNAEALKLEKVEEEKPTATEKEPSGQQPAAVKASELMIGAWLRHSGTGRLMQVTRIDAIMDGCGHFACGSPHCWDYNNRFEPVPLTAEMLEKNGFEYHSGERGMYGVTTANYYAMEGAPHIFCDGDPFAVWFEDEVPIRYVHELQHVLRLCGIEKDIEL